jgi:hypothetical protein
MDSPPYLPLELEPVLQETLPAMNPPVTLIKGARIRFAPSQPTGLHRRPISTVGLVTEGSFIFQLEGHDAKLIRRATPSSTPPGQTVVRFDNASSTEPAEIVCFYLTDTDERPAIEMLKGGLEAQPGRDLHAAGLITTSRRGKSMCPVGI